MKFTSTRPSTPPKPSQDGLPMLALFYWASLGIGALSGTATYIISASSGNDTITSISSATKVATWASSVIAPLTAATAWAIAPAHTASQHFKKRAACAVAGALIGFAECGLVSYFSQVNEGEEAEQKIEWQVAPPVIVQQNNSGPKV